MLIEVKELTQIYMKDTPFEKVALDNVSISIHQGEFIGLIGHTGSGKSTLIQHLNGLLVPELGNVLFEGKNLFEKGTSLKEIRKKVGLVFQYPEHQLFEANIFDEISFGPRNLGIDQEEVKKRVYRAMEQVGLDKSFETRSPFDLSGGQKRRVAIASVLAMEPQVLILDEPTAGLDPQGKRQILSEIQRLHKEYGLTTIIVSHSMEEIAELADRILVMHQGKLAMDGTPREIFSRQKELVQLGLDVPQVTEFMSSLAEKGFTVEKGILTIKEAIDALQDLIKGGTN